MEQNNGMVKGLLIGFLAGGAIGAVLALLYAPKSGKEMRADIRQKTDDLLEDAGGYAQKKANTLIDGADRILSGAREKASSVVEEGARIANAAKASVEAFNQERKKS